MFVFYLMILTVRCLDSNWWHSLIKQSYLYKTSCELAFIIVIRLFVCLCVSVVASNESTMERQDKPTTTMAQCRWEVNIQVRSSERAREVHKQTHRNEEQKIGKRKYVKKSTNIDPRSSQCKGEFQVWRKVKAQQQQTTSQFTYIDCGSVTIVAKLPLRKCQKRRGEMKQIRFRFRLSQPTIGKIACHILDSTNTHTHKQMNTSEWLSLFLAILVLNLVKCCTLFTVSRS